MKKEEREAQECGIWNSEFGKKIENRRQRSWKSEGGMRNVERKKEEKEQKTDGTGGARIVWHLITLVVYQEGVI